MTTPTKAIREAIAEAKDKEAKTRDRLDALVLNRQRLEAALAALNGECPHDPIPAVEAKRGSRTGAKNRGPIVSKAKRRLAIVDYLRQHPDDGFGPADLARALDAPHSSVQNAVHDLLDSGLVKRIGTSGRGQPKIQYRPLKVTDGVAA